MLSFIQIITNVVILLKIESYLRIFTRHSYNFVFLINLKKYDFVTPTGTVIWPLLKVTSNRRICFIVVN